MRFLDYINCENFSIVFSENKPTLQPLEIILCYWSYYVIGHKISVAPVVFKTRILRSLDRVYIDNLHTTSDFLPDVAIGITY